MRIKRSRQQSMPKRDEATQQNIESVLLCLKNRFPQYSIEDIISSLCRKLEQDRRMDRNRHHFQEHFVPNLAESQDEYRDAPCRLTSNRSIVIPRRMVQMAPSIAQRHQQQKYKEEITRMVARNFYQTGDNYPYCRELIKQMTPQQYTSYIHHINRHILRAIADYIRYGFNIVIEVMSTEHKNILVPKLKKVNEWLGAKSAANMSTYKKFLYKQFVDPEQFEISCDETLSLYKTLMEVAKAQPVDLMRIFEDVPNKTPPPYVDSNHHKDIASLFSYTKDEEKTIVSTFIKQKNLKKVAKFMTDCQEDQNKNNKKWSINSIKELLVYVIKKALKKVIITKNINIKNACHANFLESDSLANKIFNSQEKELLRDKLFSFYLVNRITSTQLLSIIKEINEFYRANEQQVSAAAFMDKNQDLSIIPKVQFDHNTEKSTAAPTVKRQVQRNRAPAPQSNIIEIKDESPIENASKSIEDLETLPDLNEKKQEFVEITYDSKLCNMVIEIDE